MQKPVGEDFGYQHIWNDASASVATSPAITWLDGHRYYSAISATSGNSDVIFGRTGANDPNFNIISEPLFILREKAKSHLFASAIEAHGFFDEAKESSKQARPVIKAVKVIGL